MFKGIRAIEASDRDARDRSNCLFAIDEVDVKSLLRGQADDLAIVQLVQQNVFAKWEGHEINTSRFVKPLRTMHAIGG